MIFPKQTQTTAVGGGNRFRLLFLSVPTLERHLSAATGKEWQETGIEPATAAVTGLRK
jgi:hypothetical protein